MIHYSCDLCGRMVRDERYVVKIEVEAAFDPEELTEEDLEADHLEQIADALSEMETTGEFELDEAPSKSFTFDLCPSCQRRFIKSPLGPVRSGRMDYSKN